MNRCLPIMACLAILLPAFVVHGHGIREHKNIPYLEDAGYADDKDKLDIFVPGGQGPFPVLYFIHGGGLLRGDKSMYDFIGHYFAAKGIITVNVNHRLSPQVAHPSHIEDVAASFAWVKKNIAEYRGDSDRIAVVGHSAGAYLAALIALDESYLSAHDLSLSDIAAVAPISGFFHVERLAPSRPKSVWGEIESDWIAASPAKHASGTAPPMLLLYADGDVPERRKESEDLADLLRKADSSFVTTEEIKDRTHVTIVREMGSDADRTTQAVLEFMIQRGLLNKKEKEK